MEKKEKKGKKGGKKGTDVDRRVFQADGATWKAAVNLRPTC